MKKILGTTVSFVILLLLLSGAFTNFVAFLEWLFALKHSLPETSRAGGIIVRVLTFVVSYGLVGILFNLFGWFNSKAMSITYSIVSALLGFVFAYIVWTIEQHILIIGIVLGLILLAVVLYFVFAVIRGKKKKTNKS